MSSAPKKNESKVRKGDMIATRSGYGETLVELGEAHKDIVVMDADLAKSTTSLVFGKAFPERFKYAGISEADMISMSAGLARSGKTPFVSSFACFLITRGYDQIRVSVAYSNSNVKINGSHGGIITGQDGPTGQGITDIAAMRNMPNVNVLVPADYLEAKACTRLMYNNAGPFYMRTAREKTPVLYNEEPKLELGKAVLLREGNDAAIIACGTLVSEALKAREILDEKGVSVSVLNCFSIKPLDVEAVAREAEKGVVVSCEDGVVNGLGSAVAEVIAERGINAILYRVGLNNSFAESGNGYALLKKYKMDAEAIATKILSMIGARK